MRRSQLSAGASAEFTTETQKTQRNTESSRKTRGLKRKDAKTQRRRVFFSNGVERPPTPYGCTASSAIGSESERSSPLADLAEAGFARSWRTGRRASRCSDPGGPFAERPAAREPCLGGGTDGLESLFSRTFAHPIESGRSPRWPGSIPEPTGQRPLRLCAFALNLFLSGDRKCGSPTDDLNAPEYAEQLKPTSVLSFSVSSVSLWFKCSWFDPTAMRESAA